MHLTGTEHQRREVVGKIGGLSSTVTFYSVERIVPFCCSARNVITAVIRHKNVAIKKTT